MIPIASLQPVYRWLPAAVLGGGPSLPSDMDRLPEDTVLISVNHHALRLCQPEFVVFMDKLTNIPDMAAAMSDRWRGLKVSQIPSQSDVDLTGVDYWDGGFSSTLATWLACFLGCSPVLLCGMDCYQGEQKYFYPRVNTHPCMNYPLENHLQAWRPALERCPNSQAIRAMSGPLVSIFGTYQ